MRKLKKSVKRGIIKTLLAGSALAVLPLFPAKLEAETLDTTQKLSNLLNIKDNIATSELNDLLASNLKANSNVLKVSSNIDLKKPGLQFVSIKAQDKSSLSFKTFQVPVAITPSTEPKISLTTTEAIVYKGNNFNPLTLISNIKSFNNQLPTIAIEGEVDTNTNGLYTLKFISTNQLGERCTQTVNVLVKESPEDTIALTEQDESNYQDYLAEQERLEQERLKKIEEEKKRQEEEAKKAEEARRLAALQAQTQLSTQSSYQAPSTSGGSNPYSGGWGNCTWGAWQLVHDNLGISLPAWGNAGNWLANARASGWNTGSTPKPGAIVVSTHHVAYVTNVAADGNSVYVKEGNYNGHYHEGWTIANGCNSQCVLGYIYP